MHNKTPWITTAILITAVSIFAFTYLLIGDGLLKTKSFINKTTGRSSVPLTISDQQSVTKENSETINTNTSTWKTYTNEDYGFSFKYPAKGIVEEDIVGSIIVWESEDPGLIPGTDAPPQTPFVKIFASHYNSSNRDQFVINNETQGLDLEYVSKQDFFINHLPATEYKFKYDFTGYEVYVLYTFDNNTYVKFNTNPFVRYADGGFLKEILSTFEIIS